MTTHRDDSDRNSSRFDRSADGSRADQGEAGEGRTGRRHRRQAHSRGGRKERVLHTRISEQLSEDIRRLADDLRVPASNLVRNVLEEVFTMVESVSEDVGELFEDVLDEASEARERVRRRVSRRRNHSTSASARRRDEAGSDEHVERELRRDESAEHSARPANAAPCEPERESAARTGSPEEPRPRPTFPDVLGWQPLVLNHDRVCARCGVALRRGSQACIGLTAQGLSDATLCRPCTGTRD